MKPFAAFFVACALLTGCGSDEESADSARNEAPATTAEREPEPRQPATEEQTAEEEPANEEPTTGDDANADAQRFFLRMDDLAIDLEDAISDAQDGAPGAVERIARLRTRIRDRLNDHLLDGGDTSVGANLLLSAATTARTAARAGDVAELADQRREIAAARSQLAEDLRN